MPAETTAVAHDADLGADAFSFRLLGRAFAPHFHHAWVVGCVLSGKRQLVVQGRPCLAAGGAVVILRPGEVHSCAPAGSAPFVWRGFHFPAGSPVATQLDAAAASGGLPGPVVTGAGMFDDLLDAHALVGGTAPLARKRTRLLTALGRLGVGEPYPQAPVRDRHRELHEPALEALRTHLEAHAGDRFSLEDMANIARMGKFRLVRAFTRMTGATPYRYLESARVNRAQELLAKGLPLAEVALEAGFADQSHLVRAFRTRLGVTPGACRRRP